MTNAKQGHTPGPWKAVKAGYGWDIRGGEGRGVWLATVLDNHSDDDGIYNDGFPSDETCGHNTSLIASAPDLLAERDALREQNRVLREALSEVTRCLKWHVDGGRGVAMDAKAVADAQAALKSGAA